MPRTHTKKVLGGQKSVETLHGTALPPSNNMGAHFTPAPVAPSENQVLIDWFSFTLKETDPHEAIKKAGLTGFDFSESKGGGMGYKSSLRAGNIVVFYDGNVDMGCHISMTGQGCRQFESVFKKSNRWICFFLLLIQSNATFKRLDIAVDNVDGALDLDRLQEAIDAKKIRSKFKGGHRIQNFTFSPEDNTPQGQTIYAGSPSSRVKIRFYDKAAQMNISTHWTRAELQCRDERAVEAIKILLKGVEAGHLASSVLNNYFQVINLDDSNRTRCTVQDWWQAWIQSTEKIRLTTMKAIKVVAEVVAHIQKQYSASFAMIKKFMGVIDFHEFIHDLVDLGKDRMKKRHDMIIACSRLVTEPPEEYYPF